MTGAAPGAERDASKPAGWYPPRRVALLGGTTQAADWRTAAMHLASPGRLVQGPSIAAFERAFADTVGTTHAISFAAGRVGLYGILSALGIGSGDEVLLQAPTHVVVANAIRYTGARPIYVDCEHNAYNIDLSLVPRLITPRTRALLVQHTFGTPVDMAIARGLADEHGLHLIEDCVHALGATFNGRRVGAIGDVAFFSTEETKTISTTMGGMVTTGSDELAARLRDFQMSCSWPSAYQAARQLLKLALYHFLTEPTVHVASRRAYELVGRRHPLPRPTEDAELRGERPRGYARRLSNGQAAVGLTQLGSLEANLAHRAWAAAEYRRLLAPHGFRLPEPLAEAEAAFVRYPVWVDNRAAAERAVDPRAVLGTWFTSVLEEAVSPAVGEYIDGSCPRAEEAARHLVNLPTHPRVGGRDIDAIVTRLIASQG